MKKIFAFFAFFVCVAANAATICDTFENDTAGSAPSSSWSGDGIVTNEVATQPAYGYPIADATHTNALLVDGTAARTLTSVSSANVADFMMRIALPDETPTDATMGDDDLFAIATETNGTLLVYAKTESGGTTNWNTLAATTYSEDDWVRLTIGVTNTATKAFTVAINGVQTGTTYFMAGSGTVLTNATATGTFSLDDFVVKYDTSTTYDPYASVTTDGSAAATSSAVTDASGNTVSVPSNYLTAHGKTSSDVDSKVVDTASLTLAQAYWAGVNPTNGVLQISEGVASSDGTAWQIKFNGTWDASTYKVQYRTSTDGEWATLSPTFEGALGEDENTATFSLPNEDVVYINVVR